MEYETLNADRGSIVLMRVENGWLIRSDNRATASFTPLRVAETPAALVEIVRVWAEAQVPKCAGQSAAAMSRHAQDALSAEARSRANADWLQGRLGNPDEWRAETGKAVSA